MELNQLETFWRGRGEEFLAAAVRLHRTQPAVSQVIRKLEASVGETLFDRAARDGSLTAAGYCCTTTPCALCLAPGG